MNQFFSRRDFLAMSAKGVGAAVISYGLMGCTHTSDKAGFLHGVASGDPTDSDLIIWTRITPKNEGDFVVSWEVATDADFKTIITNGETTTNTDRDYTVKVDAIGLESSQQYFYRFKCGKKYSEIGKAKTLAVGSVEQVKLAILSCSNFPAGHFNVYKLAAEIGDLDAVLHLGDYIYEYRNGTYASENAKSLGRESKPNNELFNLADYRTRYAQYKEDPSLKLLHANVAFINVWDDHEISDNTWLEGAKSHVDDKENFNARKEAALQAYFEWLPLRPANPGNNNEIYRSFKFGDLVDLHMLDTRVIGRDKQLDYQNYLNWNTKVIDKERLYVDLHDSNRSMLGSEQLHWLQNTLVSSTSKWQVLGQQVLMGKTYLPEPISSGQLSISEYIELNNLASLNQRINQNDINITASEHLAVSENKERLTENVIAQLTMPEIPFNLDAWDGYPYERELIYSTAKANDINLVVLAGDTHNAWANDLVDEQGDVIGVEFATSSVSSPGLEVDVVEGEENFTEETLVNMVDDLKYLNIKDRGFTVVTFTEEQVKSDWHYVDTILSTQFSENIARHYSVISKAESPKITNN